MQKKKTRLLTRLVTAHLAPIVRFNRPKVYGMHLHQQDDKHVIN
jgi:hypothetical protein